MVHSDLSYYHATLYVPDTLESFMEMEAICINIMSTICIDVVSGHTKQRSIVYGVISLHTVLPSTVENLTCGFTAFPTVFQPRKAEKDKTLAVCCETPSKVEKDGRIPLVKL